MATGGSAEGRVLTITWRIENIGLAESRHLWTGITSPVFQARTLEGKEFHLGLGPNRKSGINKEITLQLILLDDSLKFHIDCEWSFIGNSGSPIVSGTMRKQVMKRNKPFSMPGCPTHAEVFAIRKLDFLPNDALTVQFRIWRSVGNLSNSEVVSCRTKLDPVHFLSLWHIPGFSTLQLNRAVTTPVMLENAGGSGNFLLKFSLKGASLEDSRAHIELTAISVTTNLPVIFKVCVFSNDHTVFKDRVIKSEFFVLKNCRDTWIVSNLVTRKEIQQENSNCLKNDVLTVRYEINTLWYTEVVDK